MRRPVNIVVRDGTHWGEAAYVLIKFVPRNASLRRLGICTKEETVDVGSRTLPSILSHIRNKMFG